MYNSPYSSYPYSAPYGNPQYMQRGYAPQAQPIVQPQMQPQPQVQTPYEIPIQDVRFVTSEEARAYIVMPNARALLIDKNGLAYLKTADNMGQSQTQYFRFEPVNADGTPIKPQEPAPTVDLSAFIKKEEIGTLGFVTMEQYNALLQRLDQIQKQIMGAKQNVATTK